MAQMGRPGLSATQKLELWRRWKEGQSLTEIGNALGKQAASIHGTVAITGGIAPAIRCRAEQALSSSEREEISRGIAAGCSMRQIARSIGRAASTVSREIARNGGARRYRAAHAEDAAWKRARRPKLCRLAQHPRLCSMVARKLALDWSPEQIAAWLRLNYASQSDMHISYEAIYRSLFVQARGVLKRELVGHLRSRRMMRRSQHSTTAGQPRGRIPEAVSIRERPAEVEDRAVPGHWECDMISGSNNSHIVTLVERASRFTMLIRIQGKDTASVVGAMSKQVRRLPVELRRSLTWDRGGEMANHRDFSIATDVKVYFCDPRSPWQRGTNENTNRLLRQYFPKGTDLSVHSQAELNRIARQLNGRPRKTLGFRTPAATLQASVAMTG